MIQRFLFSLTLMVGGIFFIISGMSLTAPGTVRSQPPPKPYGALPSPAQIAWQETEMYCIIHFGVDTYTDREWGFGDEDPAILNPDGFDAMQIVGAAKAGGFNGVVIVAKHHDGFCLWPTETTGHNITKSPWKNGRGDMVKEYQLACSRLGMRLGLYCSPWDRNNAQYGQPAYVQTYRAQLKELYTRYGPVFMSWHDGANGGDGYYGGARETRKIDRTTYYGWDSTWAMIRRLQPGAAIFGDIGPDIRWVGNEEGHAGATCWATYTPHAPDPGRRPSNGYSKYQEATEGTRNGDYWMPAECDVPLRPGWFYHASQDGQVKTPYQLLDLYYQSVGRGAGLDLGISPNRQGRISPTDVASLRTFGDLRRQTFSVNLARGATFTASNIRGNDNRRYGPARLEDDDRYSYWATDDSVTQPQLIVDLGHPTVFNVIRLRENIKLGQRISSFSIDGYENGVWQSLGDWTSIGANRLIRLHQAVRFAKLRLSITGAGACIALGDLGLFLEPAEVLRAEHAGIASYSGLSGDGAAGGAAPGNAVSKGAVSGGAAPGGAAAQTPGLSKTGWRVIGSAVATGASAPGNAIDGDPATTWSTLQNDPAATAQFPQDLLIDMGKPQTVTAFTYLPRQDKQTDGTADRYIFYTSPDGSNWQKAAEGEFSNIRANPIGQLVSLPHPVSTRYFKFSIVRVTGGNGVAVAEVGVQ